MSEMYNYFYNGVYISCGYITPDGDGEEYGYEGNMYFEDFGWDKSYYEINNPISEAEDLFWNYRKNGEDWYDAVYHAIKDVIIKSLPEGTKITSLLVWEEYSGYIIHDENEPV